MKYVTAFNGARDNYELPLAVHEAGALVCHVTDLYLSSSAHRLATKTGMRIASRHREGLPAHKTALNFGAIANNAALRLTNRKGSAAALFQKISISLATAAGEIAERERAGLFLLSGEAYWAFRKYDAGRKLVFQYHPAAAYGNEIIASELERAPYMVQSYRREVLVESPETQERQAAEWSQADYVVCASSVTRKSIIASGCDPRKIRVVPYSQTSSVASAELYSKRTAQSKCRFLFVGQGSIRKGLHHLLAAWSKFAPSDSELTIVVNNLDPALEPRLDAPNLNVLTRLSPMELGRVYQSHDVFVLPSLMEGFGLVYLEALSHGLYVIGGRETGLADMNLSSAVAKLLDNIDSETVLRALEEARTRFQDGWVDKMLIKSEVQRIPSDSFRRGIRAVISEAEA